MPYIVIPTAAEAIAAWETAGDLAATLYVYDADAVTLPPLPAALERLHCGDCLRLTSLPALPAVLASLSCHGCPRLASLPALPAGLTFLSFYGCTRIISPPTLMHGNWTGIPDACPLKLALLNWYPVDRRLWRLKVAEQHARQRSAVAAVLPSLALLYV